MFDLLARYPYGLCLTEYNVDVEKWINTDFTKQYLDIAKDFRGTSNPQVIRIKLGHGNHRPANGNLY